MLKYREFLDLTDEEIKFILTEMFNPTKIENIKRNKEYNEITAEITTDGWDNGDGEEFEIEDVITLNIPKIDSCGLEAHFLPLVVLILKKDNEDPCLNSLL